MPKSDFMDDIASVAVSPMSWFSKINLTLGHHALVTFRVNSSNSPAVRSAFSWHVRAMTCSLATVAQKRRSCEQTNPSLTR